ncbi:hypothetical protein 2 [Beihai picorna-like virus 54]|uniref:hypothetical protein 2 n=1 Tax=Beihai picorna-like virus 54 TaxID=1922599 RepID=UPI00090C2824|nr:hypothetical protein 2 [Beihai picorna-like virus 54]APG76864.1 hypothetical protein 2 [Beihai picorna-like virus 54]
MNEQQDPTFGNADTSDIPSDFFERPVKIAEYEWSIGANLFETINPWTAYFEEPRVANKMAHFRNLRCSLRVKFVLNGNPFYFGRVIASAQPLPFLDNMTKFEDGVRQDFIQASQRPHVYLNPTTCEGGELVLPFFFYKNTLDITRAEWRDMGVITLASLNDLKHANNAAEPITISVFAMAENVNVSTPTSIVFPAILPQSGEVPVESESTMRMCARCLWIVLTALVGDNACRSSPDDDSEEMKDDDDSFITWVKQAQEAEQDNTLVIRDATSDEVVKVVEPQSIEIYHESCFTCMSSDSDTIFPDVVISMEPQSGEQPTNDEYGMVSAPAHQVANLAGDLSNAPIIGPYARATQMIASGIANMAQLFGFSRPRVVEEPCSYLPRHAGHLAVTNVPDNIGSLAVDAKKEVTVDGRVVGLDGMDEMAIVPIACRESYLTTFDWSITDNPNDALYSQRITPLIFDVNGGDYHLTPSAWTQMPFQYWKGSMEIRFKIVCSDYHRGRIRIVWDPIYFPSTYNNIYNVAYTEVIDISETRDFSVRIGWGQQTSYLPCGRIRDLTDLIAPRAFYDAFNPYCNGALTVMVVNQLTTPASTEPIEINVYTKMCEDYEVAVPECFNLSDINLSITPATFAGDGPLGGDPYAPPITEPPPPPPPLTEFPFTSLTHPIWFSGVDTALVRVGGTSSISEPFAGSDTFRSYLEFSPTYPGNPYTAEVTLPSDEPAGTYPVTVTLDAVFFTPPFNTGTPVNLEFLTGDGITSLATMNTSIGAIRDNTNASVTINLDFDGSFGTRFLIRDIDAGTNVNHEQARILIERLEYPFPNDWLVRTFTADNYNTPGGDGSGAWQALNLPGNVLQNPVFNDAGGRPYLLMTTPFLVRCNTAGPPIADPRAVIIMDVDNPADVGNQLRFNNQDIFLRNPDSALQRDIMMYTINDPSRVGGFPAWNVSTTGPDFNIRLYGMMTISDAILPESGEEMIQDGAEDEANAPIKANTEMYMAPVSDSGQINSVHFGERITSWRQMLKRYNDVLRLQTSANTSLVLNDVEIDDPIFSTFYPGFIENPEMPLMRWVRSGYLARRGSIRYKVLVASKIGEVKTASMGRVCLDDRAIGLLDGIPNADLSRISHAGSTFANISDTGVIDAEVPFYTNLRFQPARVFQDYDEQLDRGKEYTWFKLDMFSEDNANVIDIAQAASEDLTFHFFLSAPIVNLKP